MNRRSATLLLPVLLLHAGPAAAQQRPLDTQDPETIGEGRMLVEGGISAAHDQFYPLSGLKGELWQLPVLGLDVGISSRADLQLTGGPFNYLSITSRQPAPLADLVTATGDSSHSVEDITIGAKIRLVAEAPRRPAFGFRFVTRLPNAKHASGMGQSTTDFGASILLGKSVESVRVAGNLGFTIMSEPLNPTKQNDVLTYGLSFSRAFAAKADLVGEVNGWASTRPGAAPVGTESRGRVTLGGRYTQGPVRFDAGVFFGLHAIDPTVGFRAGVTWVFKMFSP
jgi:hypothetical protein